MLFVSAMVTAGLTAFYTARAYFLTFWGEEKIPPEAGEHAHESPAVMTVPLMILAVGAVGVGIVLGPTGIFEGVSGKALGTLRPVLSRPRMLMEAGGGAILVMIGSSVIALPAGIGLAGLVMYPEEPRPGKAMVAQDGDALRAVSQPVLSG